MADGGLHIELDEALAARIRAAASGAGMTPEAYASSMLRTALDDLSETSARLAEYDRTGVAYALEDVVAEFEQRVRDGVGKA